MQAKGALTLARGAPWLLRRGGLNKRQITVGEDKQGPGDKGGLGLFCFWFKGLCPWGLDDLR